MARLRLLLLCVGLLFTTTSPSLSADESTIPYIYYYANTANAIVVERADGTDSRLIAPDAMPPGHSVISDLDWSPSGQWSQWMAWRSSTYNGPGALSYSGWIARSDGSQRLTLLDNAGLILALKWSPTDDLLYVAYAAPGRLLKLTIIDPNTNTIIAQTNYQYDYLGAWFEGFPSGWLEDGSGIYFTLRFENTNLLGQLSITNQTSNRVVTTSQNTDPFLINLFNGRLLSYESFYEEGQQVRLTMRDLSSDKNVFIDSQSLASFNQNLHGFQVSWNPTMTHALILEWICADIDLHCLYPNIPQTHLYLLDWEAGTLQFLAARVLTPNYYDNPVMGQYGSALWSPDGHHALIRDELKHFIVVDVTTGELFPSINLASVGGWQWTKQSDALIFYSYLGRRLYRYDLTQKTLSPLDATIPRYSWFSLSPDGRFVGLINRYAGDVTAPDMFDLKTRAKRRWPHHSLGTSAGPILQYVWHPGSRWFMTAEWSAFSSGGPGPSSVTVLNTAGDLRRELGVCGWIGTCAGFVPDRVVPHLGEGHLKPVIPEPEYLLRHNDKVVALAWSADGTKIASYAPHPTYNTGGIITIWDVSTTPERLTAFDTELSGVRISWNPNGQFISLNNGEAEETWDIQSGIRIAARSLKYWRPDNNVTRIIPSPDRRYNVYARNSERDIAILNTATGQTVDTFSSEQTSDILWSKDSQMLFITNSYGSVMVWHNGNIRMINSEYGDMSAAADGLHKNIFTASFYHRIKVWDAETGEQLPDINWYAIAVALSPDGTRLAAAGSSLVTIWDTAEFDR
jgi:WD40 repeat protein